MTTSSERVMDDYLGRLEHSLSDVPAAQRKVIIAEIVTHIDEALAEEPDDSEASVRNVLDRVGDPEEIASEAREDLDIRRPRPSVLDALALVLLLIGGFLYLVGWIAGVVFLWLSDVWSTRQKIIGTLFVPGGLVAPLILFLGSVNFTGTSCSTSGVGVKRRRFVRAARASCLSGCSLACSSSWSLHRSRRPSTWAGRSFAHVESEIWHSLKWRCSDPLVAGATFHSYERVSSTANSGADTTCLEGARNIGLGTVGEPGGLSSGVRTKCNQVSMFAPGWPRQSARSDSGPKPRWRRLGLAQGRPAAQR